MRAESKRATASTMAQRNSTARLYCRVPRQASIINEILASLVFLLESRHTASSERHTVLVAIDEMIRWKIDASLMKRACR